MTPWSEDAARDAITAHLCGRGRGVRRGRRQLAAASAGRPAGARRPVGQPAYFGATGVVWALRDLAAQGAVTLASRLHAAGSKASPSARGAKPPTSSMARPRTCSVRAHRCCWPGKPRARADFADRLHELVRGNLHNPAHEPLWGNAGTLLAAIPMAEADGPVAERSPLAGAGARRP
jgi:hypothetical protein